MDENLAGSILRSLIRFNFWADARLLAACEGLDPGQFTRSVEPDAGWGSLRGVLVHILDTEFGWRAALEPDVADEILDPVDFPNPAALKTRWEKEEGAWLAFAGGLSDAEIERSRDGAGREGPTVWQTIVHVVAHGIQHRAEAAWILTGYGHSPGELDFDVFLREDSAA